MRKISKYGIEGQFDRLTNILKYHVNTDEADKTRNPRELTKYMETVLETIRRDAKKNGGLERITISTHGKYSYQLSQTLEELANKAERQKEKQSYFGDWSPLIKYPADSLVAFGGVIGLSAGYVFGSEYSTQAAEYLNNNSYLFAPISGLVQFVGSIGATIIGTCLGAVAGVIPSSLFIIPYHRIAFSQASKVEDYQEMKQKLKVN